MFSPSEISNGIISNRKIALEWLSKNHLIAGQLAVVAIPVFGWLTSGYDIVPDIGRLSSSQVFIICLYAAAFGVAAIYAAIATASCFRALYRFHSQGKNSKLAWLLLLPFPGCLFIPVILLRIAFTSRRSVKWIDRLRIHDPDHTQCLGFSLFLF